MVHQFEKKILSKSHLDIFDQPSKVYTAKKLAKSINSEREKNNKSPFSQKLYQIGAYSTKVVKDELNYHQNYVGE